MQTHRAFFCVEADLFIAKGSNKPSRDTRGDIIATGNDVFSRSTPSPSEKFRSRQIVFFWRNLILNEGFFSNECRVLKGWVCRKPKRETVCGFNPPTGRLCISRSTATLTKTVPIFRGCFFMESVYSTLKQDKERFVFLPFSYHRNENCG